MIIDNQYFSFDTTGNEYVDNMLQVIVDIARDNEIDTWGDAGSDITPAEMIQDAAEDIAMHINALELKIRLIQM